MVNGIICNVISPKTRLYWNNLLTDLFLDYIQCLSSSCQGSECTFSVVPLGKSSVKLEKMDVLARA